MQASISIFTISIADIFKTNYLTNNVLYLSTKSGFGCLYSHLARPHSIVLITDKADRNGQSGLWFLAIT